MCEIRKKWQRSGKCRENFLLPPQKGFFLFICTPICRRDRQEPRFGLISEIMFIQREAAVAATAWFWSLSFWRGTHALSQDLGWMWWPVPDAIQDAMLNSVDVNVPSFSARQVPIVAIITTGGGLKSMTGLYGSLMGLKKLNLLDCITYISGLSGTTW